MTKQEMAKFRKRKRRILALLAGGNTQAEICRKMKLTPQRVSQIINGK